MPNNLNNLLRKMTDDCEHLVNIIEGKAEQEWNYDYQRLRIAEARAALNTAECSDG